MSAAAEEGRVHELSVSIRREDVLHFLGYPTGQSPASRIGVLVEGTILEARRLASARGTFVRHPVERSRGLGLEPLEATALVIGLVTVGAELDRAVDGLVAEGEPTRALLLDAAGSAAAEEAADRLSAVAAGTETMAGASSPAPHVSCRVSPGYGGWSIRAQTSVFAALPHDALGVSLLPSMLMTPRKSISFAMWLGADRRPLAGLSGCARCGLVQCRYRRTGSENAG